LSYVYDCDRRPDLPFADVKRLLGGKAANLAVMAGDLGLPVPPAFTISTAACIEYLAHGWPDGLDAELREHMTRIERLVGEAFGGPGTPLLVSVRSGAPVSMPGMMDTILNLGLTTATTAGLAASSGSETFARNCRQRLSTMFRDVAGVADVPDDPWTQLRLAVEAVFRSWNSDRARTYRAREGIADDLGTAVTIQAMVFGNRSVDSGTGVLFTRNPATGEPVLYGDVMFNAQGEDVVAGTHRTEPIAVLDARMPAIGRELRDYATRLERHYRDLCDIEFTIEHGKLWMLQCRVGKRSPQAALRIALDMAEDPDFPLTREEAVQRVIGILPNPPRIATERDRGAAVLATGLPASPGLASGEICTSPEAAVAVADAGRAVILVRAETSPDDVHGMARSAGILTSSGGLASHAAVVARGWGIPAVVGASEVEVGDGVVTMGGQTFQAGDTITIDGGSGEVFAGAVAGGSVVVPEAATLLAWAADLAIPIGEPPPAGPEGSPGPGDAPAGVTAEALVRMLVVKGYATPEMAAAALLATADEVNPVLERLVADGLVEPSAGAFRLTKDGKALGREWIALDARRWGDGTAERALDDFLTLDGRMKQTVTAWQMRTVDGAEVFNDHSDPEYDARVLADLGALHLDAAAWARPLEAAVPQMAVYRKRLDRAVAAAHAGDHRFVASPRVDSYHGVWFELHEELILLAGRNRADEVAAGRA
jgi:pyruvate,orthophosphate dikinase